MKLIDHLYVWETAFAQAHVLNGVRIYADGTGWLDLEDVLEPPPVGPHEYYPITLPEKFIWMNAELVREGWPEMSPWWTTRLARVYFSNWIARERLHEPARQRRNMIWRVGRRGGKSSTICRVAVFECVFGDHPVPPGDTGVYAIISAERPQAKERVATIKKICDVLDVKGKPYAESFEFTDLDRAVRCFTASITSVVSFTCIGAMCDEQAIWRDTDTGTNPAKEVLASLRPTIATMKNAIIHHVSAPWSTFDEHAKQYDRGNTADQLAFMCETWVSNPTLTEAETHILEPDHPSWLRAYAAVPLASDETKFFSAALIDQAVEFSTYQHEPIEEETDEDDRTESAEPESDDDET